MAFLPFINLSSLLINHTGCRVYSKISCRTCERVVISRKNSSYAVMPSLRSLPRLEQLCMSHLSAACSAACTRIERETDANRRADAAAAAAAGDLLAVTLENRLQRILWALPASVQEALLPLVLRLQTAAISKNRKLTQLCTT